MRALLFLNGRPPQVLPDFKGYGIVGCTDGAFNYLKGKISPPEISFISGDFDSVNVDEDFREKLIETPDQDKTDFEKALEILKEKGATSVDIFGGSGKEQDHFLGNLTAAVRFKGDLKITFYDEFSRYFFAEKAEVFSNVKGKMISLYPFPKVENIVTNGLNWELAGEDLDLIERIGTRNFAVRDEVSLKFSNGNLLVFIGGKYLA